MGSENHKLDGTILVVDSVEDPQIKTALLSTGIQYLYAKHADRALEIMKAQPIDIFLARIHRQDEDFRLFDQVKIHAPNAEQIAIFDERLEIFYPKLIVRAYPRSLIADNKPLNIRELVATVQKLLTKQIFGLDPYGIEPQEPITIKGSQEKDGAIERVLNYFASHKVPPRVLENVSLILQELINNAIYDAPVNDKGERKYSSQKRSPSVLLEPKEQPILQFGINSSSLGVSVSDNFGTLQQKTFFTFVNRCFSEKKIIEEEGKSAGLGLFLVFKSLDQMIINVAYQKKSEVIALIDYHSSIRELKKRRHSFHYFHIDNM